MIRDTHERSKYYEPAFDAYIQPIKYGNKLYELDRLYLIVGCLALTGLGMIVSIIGSAGLAGLI